MSTFLSTFDVDVSISYYYTVHFVSLKSCVVGFEGPRCKATMSESTLCKAVDGGTRSDQEMFMATARNTWGIDRLGSTTKGSIVSSFSHRASQFGMRDIFPKPSKFRALPKQDFPK